MLGSSVRFPISHQFWSYGLEFLNIHRFSQFSLSSWFCSLAFLVPLRHKSSSLMNSAPFMCELELLKLQQLSVLNRMKLQHDRLIVLSLFIYFYLKKMPQFSSPASQMWIFAHLLILMLLYCKSNLFGFWTFGQQHKTIHHFGLWETGMDIFTLMWLVLCLRD